MKKALRVLGVILVVGLLFAAIIASMNNKPSNAEIVWDKDMTVGNLEAKNYFIIYSDIACPYCIAFENAIVEHEEEFKEYIEKNDVLVEIRLSDFLYEYGESQSIESRYGAEAIFCAKKEGKFWDYYNLAITKVWNEYFKDSGKNAFSKFNKLKKDYWIEIGEGIGLGDDFKKCVEEDEVLDEVVASAKKTVKLVTGMPHFKFNNYTSGGFDLSWGWDYVLMYFDAGLES
ncbi:thioredoxin domain-containing protein [Candidatus Saccharibacteria bacterium]|nr:thioredoxin domain-containing protein [Candidatus Saccharibacteria bacterium]